MYAQNTSTDGLCALLEPSFLWQDPLLTDVVNTTTCPLDNYTWGVSDSDAAFDGFHGGPSNEFDTFLNDFSQSLLSEADGEACQDLSATTPESMTWDPSAQESAEPESDEVKDATTAVRPRTRSGVAKRAPKQQPGRQQQRRSRRRSPSDEEEEEQTQQQPVPNNCRTTRLQAHSAVERRYRSNLCSRFNELKQCIPALRGTSDRFASGSDCGSDRESTGDAAAGSVTKATILSTAIDYILEIQKQNTCLCAEREEWKSRFQKFEKLILMERAVTY